jgi:5-methylcytosine-specific restriction enzyme B
MPTLAEQIRIYVNRAFIEPARRAGRTEVTIVAGEVHRDMKLRSRMPAVCAALDAGKFEDEFGVVLSSRSGPRQSSTTTWRFSLRRA